MSIPLFLEKKMVGYCWILFCTGMHSVWDHVREWEKGSAHGQEPLLWWGELFHHPTGGGKGLVGSIKPINTFHVPQCVSIYFQCRLAPAAVVFVCWTSSPPPMIQILSPLYISASSRLRFLVLFRSYTSASIFPTLRPSRWAEGGTGTLTSSPSFSWPTVSPTSPMFSIEEKLCHY